MDRRSGSRSAVFLYLLALLLIRQMIRPAAHPSPCAPVSSPGPHRHQRPHHFTCAFEHAARGVVAQQLERLGKRTPLTRRNALIYLGTGFPIRALEEKEVTIFMNVATAKAEVPVDHTNGAVKNQVIQPG